MTGNNDISQQDANRPDNARRRSKAAEGLDNSDLEVRAKTAEFLGLSGNAGFVLELTLTLIKDGSVVVREKAAEALRNIGIPAVPELTHTLIHSRPPINKGELERVRRETRMLTPMLLKALKSSDKQLSYDAAMALTMTADTESIPTLIELLTKNQTHVACHAAKVLATVGTGDARVVSALADAFHQSKTSDFRSAVANALSHLDDPMAIVTLTEGLKDSNAQVRRAVAGALSSRGDKRFLEPLIIALKDSEMWVRSNAAMALGTISDTQSLPALIEATKDSQAEVRSSAVCALGEVGDRHLIPEIMRCLKDQDSDVRSSAHQDSNVRSSISFALYLIVGKAVLNDHVSMDEKVETFEALRLIPYGVGTPGSPTFPELCERILSTSQLLGPRAKMQEAAEIILAEIQRRSTQRELIVSPQQDKLEDDSRAVVSPSLAERGNGSEAPTNCGQDQTTDKNRIRAAWNKLRNR